jgi:hypothetical protein
VLLHDGATSSARMYLQVAATGDASRGGSRGIRDLAKRRDHRRYFARYGLSVVAFRPNAQAAGRRRTKWRISAITAITIKVNKASSDVKRGAMSQTMSRTKNNPRKKKLVSRRKELLLSGQIGLSLPHLASQRYGDDSKFLDNLSSAVIATAMIVGLCIGSCVEMCGQAPPSPGVLANKPDAIAFCVGISNQLARLRELSIRPTAENSADRMWLHQDILEAVTAGSLQIDAMIAQIDFEIMNVNALRGSLADSRDRTVNRYNLAGLIAGGGLGTVSSGLQLSQSQSRNSAFLGMSAGVVSSGLALAGIRAQRGGSRMFPTKSNMLAQLFGREPLPNSRYPQLVEDYLNQVPADATDARSRGNHLIAAWVAASRIESPLTTAGTQQIDRLTSRPSQSLEQRIDDLDNRASMLADLRATISLMKQDLASLLLSLPKAEAGQPYRTSNQP